MRDVVQWETPWVGLGACVWCWAKPGLASQKPASVGLSSLPGYKISAPFLHALVGICIVSNIGREGTVGSH